MNNKLFFLDQHGCAKNQVDGELIIGHLAKDGWMRTDEPQNASLIIVNSCGFIESAKTESINSVIQARAQFPQAKILLAGCLAERYQEEFADSFEEADGFLGNGDISLVRKAVAQLDKNERPVIKPLQKGVCAGDRPEFLSFAGSAYVKITEGCNNRCSFCAIPLIRGELRSRPIEEIVDEIRTLLLRGIFEINLIGQDLASYGKDFAKDKNESGLVKLLKAVCAIEGNFWLRLLYIHPDNFPSDLLDAVASDSRILPYFDIPFQSGDDEIILKMNRHGSASVYEKLVAEIRSKLPNAVLRTTFLAGFPGETEARFENTLKFLKKIEPDWSGCFAYSLEDDTPAEKFENQVDEKTSKKRCAKLEKAQQKITEKRLARHCNEKCDVIIEEIVPFKEGEETGFVIGRTWFQAPEVDGAAVIAYDVTNPKHVSQISVGARISAHISSIRGVDIEGFMI
ncbi:MAG: 30S ribosomal protein S12 methylthiotransferase RimO [Treponemataceae bacterium]|nr:30S ribosomal protein S12 methylthiotransferase RimO [Treponemataceae bacterium]